VTKPQSIAKATAVGATDPDRQSSAYLGDLRFRTLLGTAAWDSLPAAVRQRFSKRLEAGKTALYVGRVTTARRSRLGWLLAQATRLLGGPLPFDCTPGVPASVAVTEDARSGGQIWTRAYGRRCGFPQVIHSAKRFRGPTGLEEYLGWGLGMALILRADGKAIHFLSDHYFLEAFGFRLRLPRWIDPGRCSVSHIDQGGGHFTFVLKLTHPLFGELLYQEAHFRDVAPLQS
jgi:hypothetical protein